MANDVEDITKSQFACMTNILPYNLWDCFPELAKLPKPLQWWRPKYAAIGKTTHDAYHSYFSPIEQKIEQSRGEQPFARDLILGEGKFSGGETDKIFLAMNLVEAGSDTTRLTMNIFVLAAVVNPGKFLKARGEMDGICGGGGERLPAFADENDLPYIDALAKEMLR